ncbi:MAG: TolC family protein [Sporocytophaga sp.]|uniref:TolC family protein n=1 Tax=Sporocytophaga sp. TaxID=2231183 RepID=UPI001B031BB1|nr:TolC family protein [Sporocytophaga sp.]MBO9701407.1 TolC family protein [Sporocytophaga sp.]
MFICLREISILSILILISISIPVLSQDSLNTAIPLYMDNVWEKALENSKKIELSHFEEAIGKEEVREIQYERLPEIQFSGHIEHATNLAMYTNGLLNKPEQHEVIHTLYRLGTDFYLNLYDGNKLNLSVDKRKLLYEIAIEQRKYTVSDIKLQASVYYLNLMRNLIFKELMIKDIENQEKQLAEIRELLTNGVVLKSDALRVELKLSNQKLLLVQIENNIAIANQKLNILIGLADTVAVLPKEIINPELISLKSYESYLEEAMSKSFIYHISEKKEKISHIQLQYTKAAVRPKVGLYGDFWLANPQIFLFPYSPSNYTLGVVGIKARLPVSEIYINRPKNKLARLNLKKEELEHHDTEDKIRQDVYEALLRFRESLVRINVAKANIDQAAENARIVKNNFFNQAALITDLLDADIQALQTQFEYASSRMDAQIQYYKLQNILGNL